MVDIDRINQDIESLKTLDAQEYCKEAVQKIYDDFEKSRENKIKELETALEIFEKYQKVEETVEENEENPNEI